MNLPFRIQTEAGTEPVIAVDGAFDAPGLHLSHWPGNRTPEDLRHELSTGSALRFSALDAAERARRAAGCVAVGGSLTYSVCSPLPRETGEAVRAFLRRHPAFEIEPVSDPLLLQFAADCDGLGERARLRTWTHTHDCDSHFACKLVRRK